MFFFFSSAGTKLRVYHLHQDDNNRSRHTYIHVLIRLLMVLGMNGNKQVVYRVACLFTIVHQAKHRAKTPRPP